jgi:hypothetical protein
MVPNVTILYSGSLLGAHASAPQQPGQSISKSAASDVDVVRDVFGDAPAVHVSVFNFQRFGEESGAAVAGRGRRPVCAMLSDDSDREKLMVELSIVVNAKPEDKRSPFCSEALGSYREE